MSWYNRPLLQKLNKLCREWSRPLSRGQLIQLIQYDDCPQIRIAMMARSLNTWNLLFIQVWQISSWLLLWWTYLDVIAWPSDVASGLVAKRVSLLQSYIEQFLAMDLYISAAKRQVDRVKSNPPTGGMTSWCFQAIRTTIIESKRVLDIFATGPNCTFISG